MDVLLERRRVAVVELHPRRPRLELVREVTARLDDLEDAVHVRRMDAVEVDRVRVRAGVHEADAKEVTLGGPDHGARRRAVVDPGGEEDTRRDLELDVGRGQVVLADAARTVRQCRGRIEERVEVRRPADGGCLGADHRGVTHRAVDVVLRRTLAVHGRSGRERRSATPRLRARTCPRAEQRRAEPRRRAAFLV